MKKMLFLPLLVAVLFGCSSDNNESETAKQQATPEETSRAPISCMSGFTIIIDEHPTLDYTAIIKWDTSAAAYSANTTSKIEVQPLDDCMTQSGTSQPVQVYPIANLFSPAIGSMNITHLQVGKKCMRWRLVNRGFNEFMQNCTTTTPWSYYLFVQ
jgi:hypothetical protein